MSLRVRLIVAFFLFSVVPLGAVTFYSYASNLRALHVAAHPETEMLTGELTQRMQVVTTQISERVQDLMDMPMTPATSTGTSGRATSAAAPTETARVAPPAAPVSPAPPAAPAAVTATATIDPATIEGQVAGALGDVAMLLNNVEVRGLGRLGGRFGAPQRSAATDGRGTLLPGTPVDTAGLRAGVRPERTDAPDEAQPRGDAPPDAAGREGEGRRGG